MYTHYKKNLKVTLEVTEKYKYLSLKEHIKSAIIF